SRAKKSCSVHAAPGSRSFASSRSVISRFAMRRQPATRGAISSSAGMPSLPPSVRSTLLRAVRSATAWTARVRGGRTTQATWDRQYARGEWEGLKSVEESERYRHVADLCRLGHVRPTILDVGCGEGVLLDWLLHVTGAMPRYVGIDLSAEAIRRARETHPTA